MLAAAGADVVLNALTPRYVEQTAAEIAKDTDRRAMPLLADVTRVDEVQRAVDTILREFGYLDVLINHAYHFVDLERGVRRNGKLIAGDIQRHIDTIRTIAQQANLSETCLKRLEKAERVVLNM